MDGSYQRTASAAMQTDSTRERQRAYLVAEASRRMQNTTTTQQEYLRKALKQDILAYIPSPATAGKLVNEVFVTFPASVVVTTDAAQLRSNVSFDPAKIGGVDGPHPNILMSFKDFMSHPAPVRDISIMKRGFAVIFEGLNRPEELEMIQQHATYTAAAVKILITPNPTLFLRYLKAPSPKFECFVNSLFIRNPHYRLMLETCKFFYFDGADEVKGKRESSVDPELATALTERGLFYPPLFSEAPSCMSERLKCLIRAIELFEGDALSICLEDPVEERLMHELFKLIFLIRVEDVSPAVLAGMRARLRQTFQGTSWAPEGVQYTVTRTTGALIVRIISFRDIKTVKGPLILFRFTFIPTEDPKIFMLPAGAKEEIRTLIVSDVGIGEAYAEYAKRPQAALRLTSDEPTSSFRFELYTSDGAAVKMALRNRAFVQGVEQHGGRVFVTARCSIGRTATCFNLFNMTKLPVTVPRLPPTHRPVLLFCDSIEFCTITSLQHVCNSAIAYNNGFLLLSDRRISLFSFSKERNLFIEIEAEDIEDFIIVGLAKRQGRQGVSRTRAYQRRDELDGEESLSVQNEYLNVVSGREMPREFISLSFCLRNRPRVYSVDPSSEIASKILDQSNICDKYDFFTSLEWRRLSADEFKEHKERYDIRISIPCAQDVPEEHLSTFIYNFKSRDRPSKRGSDPFSTDKEAQLTHALKITFLDITLRALFNFPAKIVASELVRGPPASLDPLLEEFMSLDFQFFYPIACLVSRKARHLLSRLTAADLRRVPLSALPAYCEELDRMLSGRFRSVTFHFTPQPLPQSTCLKVRTVILTPLSITFNYESVADSNRVLRTFDPDKFCRMTIREEGGRNKFSDDLSKDTDGVYEYFRRVMLDGMVIGTRKYFFLVMTTSQLKIHGCWFVTPYECQGALVGADFIRSWVGSFQKIKNIGKYAARIGLALSSTTPTCEFEDFLEVDDETRNGYCFTDGIGLMTMRAAGRVSRALGLSYTPAAFQVRFGGYKGVLAVHPWLEDPERWAAWWGDMKNMKRDMKDGSRGDTNGDINVYQMDGKEGSTLTSPSKRHCPPPPPDFILRKSMNKFESTYRVLEVVTVPKSTVFNLNRQIIMVLEGLGVPPQVFLDLHDRHVLSLVSGMARDFHSFVKKTACPVPNVSPDLFHRKLQPLVLSNAFDDLAKAKIPVPQGRSAMGVLDELGILEEDQIFCMFKREDGERMEGLRDYGSYVVPVCHCIVAKNPVMHPGDIRSVRCVDVPQLHYLKDVVVFSKRGTRPLFNQCSGSDLDGDQFLVSWCRALMPRATFKPYSYADTCALTKESVLLSDMVNFYLRHMKLYQLGHIAHSHLAVADKLSVFSQKALRLSDLFNKNIDYAKTGLVASIPEDLVPDEYPDFMERHPSYQSEKALGILYRRPPRLGSFSFCECHSCTTREIQEQIPWKRFILLGAGVKTREIPSAEPYSQEYQLIYDSYVNDVRLLMDKAGAKTEEELLSGTADTTFKREIDQMVMRYMDLLRGRQALKMVKICGCRNMNGVINMCGDSYKLKGMVRRGIIREGTSEFIFNGKIALVDRGDVDVVGDADVSIASSPLSSSPSSSFYNGTLPADAIEIPCDLSKYKKLVQLVTPDRKDLFRDLFNLILLSGAYKIDQLDLIFDLLISLNLNMKDSSVLELLSVGLPGATDPLFKVFSVLPLDLSLCKKATCFRERQAHRINEKYRAVKICKRFMLIISGMLDENDDIEFSEQGGRVVPCLKNRGVCSAEYYRDSVRNFLINILYSCENLKFVKELSETSGRSRAVDVEFGGGEVRVNVQDTDGAAGSASAGSADPSTASTALYKICLTPGKFFFIQVPETHLNDRFSVQSIEKKISVETEDNLRFKFLNTHSALDPERRSETLSKTKRLTKVTRETLSFIYKDTRFDIELSSGENNGETGAAGDTMSSHSLRITKEKKVLGKAYIINGEGKNDVQIELFRSKVVYGEGIDCLQEDEKFMTERMFVQDGNSFRILFDRKLYGCSKMRLERSVAFFNEDGFTVAHNTLFTGTDVLYFKDERATCFVSKEFSVGNLDEVNFEGVFGKLWKIYAGVLL